MNTTVKVLLCCLTLLLLPACGSIRNWMAPESQQVYDQLLEEEATAKAEVETAKSPEEKAEAQERLAAVQKKIADIETRTLEEKFGPLWAFFMTIPVVGPYVKLFGPLSLSLLLPLASKRGRKHYKNAVRNIVPGVPSADGSKGVALTAAVIDVLRALGLAHSSEASKAAANASTT